MGLLDAVGKGLKGATKAVSGNKALKGLAVAGAVSVGSSVGGPIGGVVAGSLATDALKGGKGASKSKKQRAKATKASVSSQGSTEVALRETQSAGPAVQPKGLIASILSIFGL